MIFSLTGNVETIFSDSIILEVQGIGYQVFLTDIALKTIGSEQTKQHLITYHHIREDAQTLYGFLTQHERECFVQLIRVSGVGTKVALKIMSFAPYEQLFQLILNEDIHTLMTIPGVGKKMAERLILDLKDKIKTSETGANYDLKNQVKSQQDIALETDIKSALQALGYKTSEIERAMTRSKSSFNEATSVEQGIKILLKNL